jgi:regulation of enolase protein 1 (concanavalin A-like superfamily)
MRTLLIFACAAAALVAPACSAGELLFKDDFKGALGQGWSWIREHREGWRLTDHGLEIRVEPGNMWGPANNAKNILVRQAPDHAQKEIITSVQVENRPTEQYEQANLVWFYDDGHMVKLGLEQVDGKLTIVMGREEKDRARTIAIIPVQANRIGVRFLVKGNNLRGQYRTPESESWVDAGQCDLPVNGPPKVTLQCYQGPADQEHWARFTDFRIERAGE